MGRDLDAMRSSYILIVISGLSCTARGLRLERAAVTPHVRPPALRRAPGPRCAAEGGGGSESDGDIPVFGLKKEDNPYLTSRADRLRAKYGERVVTGSGGREGGRQVENQLEADLAQFKADAGLSGKRLAGGQSWEPEEGVEVGMLQKVINGLGTVLTYNFFIICMFFLWFLASVVAQFGFENYELITGFQGAWDWLILPLLSTHMALTFLSYGLEKVAKAGQET